MVGRISSPRFVGRVAELDVLQRALARASSGTGTAVLIAGEAGIGKSRLVSEFEERARAREALVLIGECVELAEGELAFAPIISALRGVVEDGRALEGIEGPMRSALAVLWPVAGADEGVDTGRERLFEAVYRVLARLAREQAVLLIIEDVHWIDPSSRDLLAFLVRNARRDRIAVVATYRPDELGTGHALTPFVAELERSGRAERLELEPLARREVAEQLEAISGRVPTVAALERIFVRCEGNPFFAEELLASAGAVGGELPVSLRQALLLRVERVSEVTREVLRVAAVVGRSVDHRLLADVVGVGERELLVALREATDYHVLVPSASGVAYTFRHALLREAIYTDTLIGERLRLHRGIAEALESSREYALAGAAAELAYHWLAAGDERAGLAACVEAAGEAERMHAHGEAANHIDRVLELWDRVESPDEVAGCDRVDLLLRGSEFADFSGDAEHGLALAERARAVIDERVDPLKAAAAEARIGRSLHSCGRGVEAVDHLAAARRLVPSEPPSLASAQALASEGRALILNERDNEARPRLEEALRIAELLDARRVQSSALNSLAIVLSNLGEVEQAIVAGREGLRIAKEIGSVEEIMRAYVNGSNAIDAAGNVEEALALAVEGIVTCDQFGMSRVAGDGLRCQAAWRLTRLGRYEEAERIVGEALERATTPFSIADARCIAGRVALELGDLELAEDRLEQAWSMMQSTGGLQLIGPAMAARILLAIHRGELERARERAHEGVERGTAGEGNLLFIAEVFWLAVRVEAELSELASVRDNREAPDECERIAAAALAGLDGRIAGLPGRTPPAEAIAFRALAEGELARLRGERTVQPWLAAAERFRALGQLPALGYAERRAAEALALRGARSGEIAAQLRAAHATALELGAPPLLAEVDALARRTGVPLDGGAGALAPSPAADLGLTERELEVLRLLADGRTNRQIGEELFITAKTASVHVSRILMKLGVANRAEAAAAAHRMGLARHAGVN
jgi:DNA-binding CsgD family transcriptional regulator/tetratricopeptide (TPR) repeat protein